MFKKQILIITMLITCGSSLGAERIDKKTAKKIQHMADMELLDREISALAIKPEEGLIAAGAGQSSEGRDTKSGLLKKLKDKTPSRNASVLNSSAAIVVHYSGTRRPISIGGIETKFKKIHGANIQRSSITADCNVCTFLLDVRSPGKIICKHCSLAACNKAHKDFAIQMHTLDGCPSKK